MHFLARLATVAISIIGPIAYAQNVISTAAGTDLFFTGEGQPGASVPLGRVSYVAFDPINKRPVFSDPDYNLVIRVESNGTLHVIAGNNVQGMTSSAAGAFGGSGGGYSGDGGPATSAALNRPHGIAFDASGNLYIADTYNNVIRIVNTQGMIQTFAGTGTPGVRNGAAASAQFNSPLDVAVDNTGAVYVNDWGNTLIRKIAQGVASTIAGNGTSGAGAENAAATASPLDDVEGLTVDAKGVVYFSEFNSSASRVRQILNGQITTIAGSGAPFPTAYACTVDYPPTIGDGGPALRASLYGPAGLAVDSTGLYIADLNSGRIRKYANGTLSTVAGSGRGAWVDGPASSAAFHAPYGVAASSSGDIFVADRDNFRIRWINSSKIVTTIAGNGALLSSNTGVSPLLSYLNDPFGVGFDANGKLLIADTDNSLIRSIGSNTLSTIAGYGPEECSGDGGAATQAGLASPFNVNTDAAGNLLIADYGNGRIRKDSNGTLTTLLPGLTSPTQTVTDKNGNTYIADFRSGVIAIIAPTAAATGGTSIFARGLSGPFGVALDAQNNLYVTEYSGGKIIMFRQSDRSMITVAGGGSLAGRSGDGQSALSAKLISPAGIAIDAGGDIYFTDPGDNSVRLVRNGIITTIAGDGTAGYAGDGGLATAASLRRPFGVAVAASGTVYISDTYNNRVRAVLNTPPAYSLSANQLSFTVVQNGATSDVATVNAVPSGVPALLFSVQPSQSWITVTPSPNTLAAMPAKLQITVDPTGLAPRTYNESVTVTSPGAFPPVQTIALIIVVNPATPATLDLDTKAINLAFSAGDQPATQQIQVLNRGGQPLNFTAGIPGSPSWLNISSSGATSTAGTPGTVNVTVNPQGLASGAYNSTIRITSPGIANNNCARNRGDNFCDIPVNIVVNAKSGKLSIVQPALLFTVVKGGSAPPAQSIGFVNVGSGAIQWTAAAQIAEPNTPWLSIANSAGTLNAFAANVAAITVTVNPNGVASGMHYGQVQISSDGALNSPRFVTVILNVVDAASNPGPVLSASGLLFLPSGAGSPSSQTVTITNPGASPLQFTSSRLTDSGNWLTSTPTNGVIPAGQSMNIVVQPDYSNITGVHQGSVVFSFNNASTSVNVLAVTGSAAAVAGSLKAQAEPRDACSSAKPNVQMVSSNPATSVIGVPVTIEATVLDGCNSPAASNFVVNLTFSTHEPAVHLSVASGATWSGQWTPANLGDVQFVVAATPYLSANTAFSQVQTISIASAAAATPKGVIVNGASFVSNTPVAPGTIVSIFGSDMASGVGNGDPFSTTVQNATVMLGGRVLPIYYASPSQINAQLPYDIPVNTPQTLTIQRGTVQSASTDFLVASAQPGIFTTTNNGSGQGTIFVYRGATSPLADASNPASAGDIITIYCTGLGLLNGDIPAGTAATGPVYTVDTPTLTIGSVQVTAAGIQYSGLSPGNAGLYQINAVVPSGITPANAVPITITISGQTSPNTVTMAIR